MLWSLLAAIPALATGAASPVPDQHLRVHYNRADAAYSNLCLWTWNDVVSPSSNWPTVATAFQDVQQDAYGAYLDIPLTANAKSVGMLVISRVDGSKDGGDKVVKFSKPEVNEFWIKQGSDQISYYEPVD